MEKLLADEIKSLDLSNTANLKVRRAGVDCELTIADIYRVCLWSRVANRVLYPLASFKVTDEKNYYAGLQEIAWDEHLQANGTLAVDFFCRDSCITHSQYGAQLSKDAVVDWFRDRTGTRPNAVSYTHLTLPTIYSV